jgi:hypothetical protein
MYFTIINDCQSQNDIARQETRVMSLFETPVTFVGVSSDFSVNATLEAAGTLIDVLDAAEDREGIILLNVAPRGEQKKDGHNGTPFGYFRIANTLVISTLRGQSLSLVKKLGLIKSIEVMDVEEVVTFGLENGLLTPEQATMIPSSQFRSYDFSPRVAHWLSRGINVPSKTISIDTVSSIDDCIWYIDAFGNAKTSILNHEVPVKPGEKLKTNLGNFTYYARLKDIPKGETALYAGSSGLGKDRFVEIGTQMSPGSAAKTLSLSVGQGLSFTSKL